jgi:uncharacterized delta-60 repeat protein
MKAMTIQAIVFKNGLARLVLAAALLVIGTVGVRAQTPGDTDPTFGAGLAGVTTRDRTPPFGVGGQVNVIVPLADGRVLIGGNFIEVGGTPQIGIARLNADGSLDTTFGAGQTGVSGAVTNLQVYAIAVQPDGKIVIGGQFLVVNGVIRGNLARLNADGTLDTSFGNGLSGVTGANSQVNAVAVQPDGKILIGGFFGTLNGSEHGAFARLNADGTLDAAFPDILSAGGRVGRIALQPDGKILIGGAFSTVAGASRGNVARLNTDGTIDTTFGNGLAGANSSILGLALQSDGKVIIAGLFNRVNGTLRHGVARVNADGTLDTTFGIAVNLPGQAPQSVAVQSDGKVIVGGNFNQIGGVTATNLVRLTATGTLDASFPQNLLDAGRFILAVELQDDGRVLVGGSFEQIGGVARSQMARLSAVGVVDETFVPGLGRSGLVNAITFQPDGKMLVGGDFDVLNGLPRGHVGRLNPDGTTDTTFGAVQIGPTNGTMRSVALQADGKILVGGQFNQINGAARGSVARLNADGTLDTSFGNGLSGTFDTARGIGVYTILPLTNGQILVGGYFGTFNGVATSCIVRLNADGSLDSTFGAGVTIFGGVRAIVSQPDGRLLVAGRFGFTMSPNDLGLIRLNADGTLDATFPSVTLGASITAGVGDGVGALILQPDGKIFIGGNFISVNGAPRSAIARINADGTLDTGFANDGAGPNQEVNAAVRQPDGKFIIVGEFTSVAGQARSKIARINADGTFEPTFGNGLSGAIDGLTSTSTEPPSVFALALQPDGKPVVGGQFNFINDVFHCGIARLVNPTSCPTITVGPEGSTLPNGQVNGAYSQTFTQTGGAAPASFAVTAGALPAGLTLAGDGTLTGAPTVTGTFNFTVTATDANGCFGSRAYSLSVNCQTISVSPTLATLPGGTLGVAYSQTFTQTGGVGMTEFTFSGGALPQGLTFMPETATLSGTPMASGTYLFSILATDANGCTGSRVYSLSVSCPILVLNPTNPTLPGGTVGTPYSEVLSVTGGTGPYNLSIVGGALPMGISLTGGGSLSGNPTVAGNFGFTVQARDTATNCITTRAYFITIAPAATGTPVLVNGQVNLTITGQSVEAATCPGYAADIVLTGTLTNTGTTTITDPFFEVLELRESSGPAPALPYRLLTATGASCGSGGLVGSQQPVGAPGFVLNPGQSVPVTFRVALPAMQRFRFFLNVRGILP